MLVTLHFLGYALLIKFSPNNLTGKSFTPSGNVCSQLLVIVMQLSFRLNGHIIPTIIIHLRVHQLGRQINSI